MSIRFYPSSKKLWQRLQLVVLIISLTGWGLAACNSAADSPPVEVPSTAGEPVVVRLAVTPSATAVPATPTPRPSSTATVSPAVTPALARLLRSPLPTPRPPALPITDGNFVPAPALGVTVGMTLSPVLSNTVDLSQYFTAAATLGAAVATKPIIEPTPDGIVRTAQVPILMYHYLSEPPPDADIYRRDLSVSPARFDEHLERMQAEGYTTISLYDLLAYLTQGSPLPPKPVILTFDDGYRDSYENAFPRLRAHGMIATFFVVTDFIDEERPEYLTWPMVKALFAGGMSIESHGRNHVSLRGKDTDYLVWQALGSTETLAYELGVRPRFVSYPAGEYDQLAIDIFRSANYWGGITTIQGATQASDNLFELRRVRIRGDTTADDLMRLLALDW